MSTALVLFMTPGLAFFYGGMVRGKNVLGMLMQNFFAMGLLAVLWAVVVFSLAFGDAGNGGLIGNFDFVVLKDVGVGATPRRLPWRADDPVHPVLRAYQMTFAIITPALITGATADRLKFSAYAVFIGLWLVLVYAPVAHWVFAGGWLAEHGRARLRRRRRRAHQRRRRGAGAGARARAAQGLPASEPMPPHNLPLTMLGTGHPVVRVGRLQRRLGAGRQRRRRARRS